MTVRVGLVGAGAMGEAHLRILSQSVAGAHIVAVADTDTCSALVVEDGTLSLNPPSRVGIRAARTDANPVYDDFGSVGRRLLPAARALGRLGP